MPTDFAAFSLRSLDLDHDIALIQPWYQMDYAHFWNMQNMSVAQTRAYYAEHIDSGLLEAYLGLYRGTPAFVMECYDPAKDELGRHYPVQAGDMGMHFFVGPCREPIAHFTRDVLRAVMRFLFEQLGAQRVVVEPDARNHKVHRLNRQVGFVDQAVVRLPSKTAVLACCSRQDFCQSLKE